MLRQDPTRQWELFGQKDPYYGVLTDTRFKREVLGQDARERFFASGDQQVQTLLADARALAGPDFSPESTLDYGCGVGRLLIPLAALAQRVVGVDVSTAMLAEARRNCEAFGVSNVEFLTPNQLAGSDGSFDLVVSFAVLIHVPRRAGEQLIAKLARLVQPGGVGAVSLVVKAERHLAAFNAIMKLPLAHNVLNVLRGREWSYPHMEMNVYDLNRIALVLREQGMHELHVKLGPTTAGFDLCTLFFRRES
jgi:2-polyprenyl-3-methyl-5-hydroxy-6-metoxy-1,4-benzoquinol methylase